MLMSPDSYYAIYLRGKDSRQIRRRIAALQQEIARLEVACRGRFRRHCHPRYETRLICLRQYLKMAHAALMTAEDSDPI